MCTLPTASLPALPRQVNIDVECTWVRDMLRGDDAYEMRLKMLASHNESYPFKDE